MICVIDKKENRAIKENQQIRDFSMHFHIAEMRNGQSAMAVWGLIVPACFDVTRNVPEHVTTGLANVTLHPLSGGLFSSDDSGSAIQEFRLKSIKKRYCRSLGRRINPVFGIGTLRAIRPHALST